MSNRYKEPSSTSEIIQTSETGDKLTVKANYNFNAISAEDKPADVRITVFPEQIKQTIAGIGTSFTESSAFVLAHLSTSQRNEVMHNIYSENGANFSLARTPIGSTDFCVEGKYAYTEQGNDTALTHFSISVDKDGFSQQQYSGIQDESFDLLPMIKQALAIKSEQADSTLNIIASAWTAPPWMKTIESWYRSPTAEYGFQGIGGQLKPEHRSTYANYLVKYLEAYRLEGVDIWGLTPVNEPQGNCGQWESMYFTPDTQNTFIKEFLGPALHESNNADIKLLIYDQNREELEEWTDVIFADQETAPYVYGAAVHWYESTYQVNEDVFDRVHEKFPNFSIIHTEGTIDDLGKDAPEGILDPIRFKESGWFNNDDFWWNANATDWAYTATWAPKPENHPIYTPVHRYARNIIVSINHWLEGWIDWNIVLDKDGGPNHAGNFCGAPIMIDTENSDIYYTPIYYVLSQLSRTIRPGDRAVQATKKLNGYDDDTMHACATINSENLLSVQLLNTSKQAIDYELQIGNRVAAIAMDANSLQTVRIQL